MNILISVLLLILAVNTPVMADLKIAAVQLDADDVGNFEKMSSLAATAKSEGASIIVYPESSVFGWLNPAVFTEAQPIPGTYSNAFAKIATDNDIWVVAGLAERGDKAGGNALPNAYLAYDSGIMINPSGELVLHHRKYDVLKDAFDQTACQNILGVDQCAYEQGDLSDIKAVQTPWGLASLLVCADAYVPSQYNDGAAIKTVKALQPDIVFVPWGITAGSQSQCGQQYFNATGYAGQAAEFIGTAMVVGSNATGERTYGRFLPSYYCGTSGYANPAGTQFQVGDTTEALAYMTIDYRYDVQAGPIWSNQDAQQICPGVCPPHKATWNGQWTTTIPGRMSVCGCVADVAK